MRPAGRQPGRLREHQAGRPAGGVGRERGRQHQLQGFATDISVNTGQTVRFKVNTAATAYRLDIYRLGYYGGLRRPQGRHRAALGARCRRPSRPA